MLHALRGVITPAADGVTETMRKQIFATLSGMLGHQDDSTRSAVAGCYGALVKFLTPDQLNTALNDHLLCASASADLTLKHGRSAALFVALKEAPEVIYTEKHRERVCKIILMHLANDKVQIAMNGVRACGYLFQYLMNTGQPIPQVVLTPFARVS